ncbi:MULTISPECIES: hypothetical protein [unclassified Streptomyces]|uniref:hypothetical protein n=1 Tax=unclassified Streptomyces TaxID=2593676 RepID=UPI0033B9BF79
MTDHPAAHDVGLPYLETDMGRAVTPLSQRTTADGLRMVVEGVCPRCYGPTVTEYPYGLPGVGTKSPWPFRARAVDRAPDLLADEVHFCECGHPHPSLPSDAAFVGCGASWRSAGAAAAADGGS